MAKSLRFVVGDGAFVTPHIYLDGNLIGTHQVGSSAGYQELIIPVSDGVHRILCTDPYIDVNVNTTPVSTPPTVADNGFRLLSTSIIQSKANGFWFDTVKGFIPPTIIKPVDPHGWAGLMVFGTVVSIYDFNGNVIAESVNPAAYPQYQQVTSLWQFYDINTNTLDFSKAIPPNPPIISKNVTIKGLDGQTISGRMSILDFTTFGGSNINEPPFIINARGDSFYSNISDSTQTSNLSAVSVLNFIAVHANPPSPPIVIVPVNNAKQFVLIAKNGVSAQFVLYNSDYSALLSQLTNGESANNVVDTISTAPNSLNQAITFLDGNIPNVIPPPPPPQVNNGEQFLLTAKNGNKATFVLLTNDYQQLLGHLNTGESITQAVPVSNANPDTFVSVLSFLSSNTTTTQVPPPPTPTPAPTPTPTPSPVTNPPPTTQPPSPTPQPSPIPVTSGPTISPIVIGVLVAGAAGFALMMSGGKGKKSITA